MISKYQCSKAIKLWQDNKSEFSKLKKLIYPTGVFRFTKENLDWLKRNNDNSKFHIYAAIDDGYFSFIIVPLNKDGKEIELDDYSCVNISKLKDDLTLVETQVITTVTKTVLTKNLEIAKRWKEVDLPIINEPAITENVSLKEIENWKSECTDWFYHECTNKGGKRIFNTFQVPFSDLSSNKKETEEVIGLFGFKYSSIYQMSIPILIFVAKEKDSNYVQFLQSIEPNPTSTSHDTDPNNDDTNTNDWAQPCPPLCKDKDDYTTCGN